MPNPLREGLAEERLPEPAVMVIFGASGDLTRRKLLPALYNLAVSRLLPPGMSIVGFARKAVSDDAFREEMRPACAEFARRRQLDPDLWSAFARNIFYQRGEYEEPAAFLALKDRLDDIERTLGLHGNRVFYLARLTVRLRAGDRGGGPARARSAVHALPRLRAPALVAGDRDRRQPPLTRRRGARLLMNDRRPDTRR